MKRVPITDWLTNRLVQRELAAGVQLRHPRARARPAGERSSQPGWIEVAATASAPSRPGSWKTTWWQPLIRGVRRVDRAVGRVDRRHHRQARLDQLGVARRVDDQARVGGRRDRVEVAAEGHVVGDRAVARDLDDAVAGVQERRDVADRDRRARGRSRPARAPRPGPAGTSSRITVSGSVTSTMPVSTSTVATPIVPCPHIGSSPLTSMKSTPQSASGRVGGCRIAPDIAPWPRGSRISSSRSSSMCCLEVELALQHRRARDGADAAGDDARRHPLRVGVDRREVAGGSHQTRGRLAQDRERLLERGDLVGLQRQARRAGRAAVEADGVLGGLEVLDELGGHVEAGDGEQPTVHVARPRQVVGLARPRRARRSRAGRARRRR